MALMSNSRERIYSTAEVMKVLGLGRNTLRLYEEMGLLIGMTRNGSGYREYKTRQLEDLKFILDAKKAGFTLNEVKDLLEVGRAEKKMTCGTVSDEISGKIDEIEEQLRTLKAKKDFLSEFWKICGSKKKDSKCDVISVGFSKKACCD